MFYLALFVLFVCVVEGFIITPDDRKVPVIEEEVYKGHPSDLDPDALLYEYTPIKKPARSEFKNHSLIPSDGYGKSLNLSKRKRGVK